MCIVGNFLAADDPHAVAAIETAAARRLGRGPKVQPHPIMLVGLPQKLPTIAVIQPAQGQKVTEVKRSQRSKVTRLKGQKVIFLVLPDVSIGNDSITAVEAEELEA